MESKPQEAAYEQAVNSLRWIAKRFCATTSLTVHLNGRMANVLYCQCPGRKMAVLYKQLGSRAALILDELLDAVESEALCSPSAAHTILTVSWTCEYWWNLL